MGKLISIVGNSGVGKTTLAEKLSDAGGFHLLLEDNVQRPFQKKFDEDLQGYALANQIDFLLFRAEQERFAREGEGIYVQDGGLDIDFHVFTKRFRQKGHLSDEEFELCERLYIALRAALLGPDLFVVLSAPTAVLAERMTKRQREIDIAKQEDLLAMERLLEGWLVQVDPERMIEINASEDDPGYTKLLPTLVKKINSSL